MKEWKGSSFPIISFTSITILLSIH